MSGTAPRKFERLGGAVPVFYSPGLDVLAEKVRGYLRTGSKVFSDLFDTDPPELRCLLTSAEDRDDAPRGSAEPYPPGLPYFTRSANTPTLVLPAELSEAIRPRTPLTLPLTVWHELAHAFLLERPVAKVPAWLGEFVAQASSAAVARREGLPLKEHLSAVDAPNFTARSFGLPASAGDQMSFQNLLLSLGAAALEGFGEGFLRRLIPALQNQTQAVSETRAEGLLAASLGPAGRKWLQTREEF